MFQRTLRMALAMATLVVAGCANESVTTIRSSAFVEPIKIYVPRFEGNPQFVDEATMFFASQLESRTGRAVIQGDALRAEGPDILGGGNMADSSLALAAGRKAGATYVAVGKVTSHQTGGSLNGFTTVKVYRISNGQIVAAIHRPSGLLVAYSEHQCVLASVKRAADALAKAL